MATWHSNTGNGIESVIGPSGCIIGLELVLGCLHTPAVDAAAAA
jgi:hypothetical protein